LDFKIRELANQRINLVRALKQQDSNSPASQALIAAFKEKLNAAIRYIEENKLMTRAELISQIKQKMAMQNQSQLAAADNSHMLFKQVRPGLMKLGQPGQVRDVVLTKPFEVMPSEVSTEVWNKVVDLTNNKFGSKYKIPKIADKTRKALTQLEYIQLWINAFNELSSAGDPALSELMPGYRKGDTVRLPTEKEWGFATTNSGERAYSGFEQPTLISDYAWYVESSNSAAGASSRTPMKLDSRPFFGLDGADIEWYQTPTDRNALNGTRKGIGFRLVKEHRD
jgi:hypothetical protein